MSNIIFRDNNQLNYIVNVPILQQEENTILRMWVAYDKGKRRSQYDFSIVERGYYLYFSFEEEIGGYLARTLSIDGRNGRLFLGEANKKNEKEYRQFAKLAEKIAEKAVKLYYPELNLDLDNCSRSLWDGEGTGVGMYCDFYKMYMPTKELVSDLKLE